MKKPKPWEASHPGQRDIQDYGYSWWHDGVTIPIDDKMVVVDFSKGNRVIDDGTTPGIWEMKKWCKQNRIAIVNHNELSRDRVAFRFRTSQDATHFKLVWG